MRLCIQAGSSLAVAKAEVYTISVVSSETIEYKEVFSQFFFLLPTSGFSKAISLT